MEDLNLDIQCNVIQVDAGGFKQKALEIRLESVDVKHLLDQFDEDDLFDYLKQQNFDFETALEWETDN